MPIICAGLLVGGAVQATLPPPVRPAVQQEHPVGRAQELVQEYVQAAGVVGLRAIHTRSCQGEVTRTASGTTAGEGVAPFQGRLELDWKEPGRAREVWTSGTVRLRRISDGEHGWEVGTGTPRRELRPAERVELARLGALYQPAIVLPMEELTSVRKDKVGERAAWVLQTKTNEQLWLDQETHLPLRLDLLVERLEPSRAGEFYLSQIFFEDWQPVASSAPLAADAGTPKPVLLPRTIRRVLAQATFVYKFDDLKHDLDLSNGLFKIPYFWRK